jgi:hypothetical protein
VSDTNTAEQWPDLTELLKQIPSHQVPTALSTLIARLAVQEAPRVGVVTGRNLSVKEAAAILGVHPSFLYHHWKGMKCARRIGRKLMFDSVGLEKWRTREGTFIKANCGPLVKVQR